MYIYDRKSSFYIGNCIALLILFILCFMSTLVFYIMDGYVISTYMVFVISIVLFFIDIYYLLNTINDNKIRKKGVSKKAKIVKVFDRAFRFSPTINTIIVFEYVDKYNKIIQTKENVNNINHIFKKGEKIYVLFDGKKALLNRDEYKKIVGWIFGLYY